MGKVLEPYFGFGIKVVHLSSVVVKSSDCCTDVLSSIPRPDTCDRQYLAMHSELQNER